MSNKPRFSFPIGTSQLSTVAPSMSTGEQWSGVADAEAWRQLFDRLHSGTGASTYPQRAARLNAYGWTPNDLDRVCSGSRHVTNLLDPAHATEQEAEAYAALVDEARAYYSTGLAAASGLRTGYLVRLAGHGWTQSELGNLVGLTRQRVQKLIQEWHRQRG